jgi:hypothetical protein
MKCIEDLHVLEEMIYCANIMRNLKRGGNRNSIERNNGIYSGGNHLLKYPIFDRELVTDRSPKSRYDTEWRLLLHARI